ncbi:MAG: YafY family transcriptional regulator [Burkholderiales bacterium]|nr:YafY family transcriptional regulator [Anaerolineae bacterium]
MRADRLLSILFLLQIHRRLTAGELARRLEVSERTIHRDMDALSTAGIPVTAERGSNGGWVLLEDFRTNLTGLNETEIQAMFLANPTRLLTDLGLKQAAESALIKLLAALPSMSRQGAEYARQRIYVDAAGWHDVNEDISALPSLQEAIWQERKMRLSYERGDGAAVERLVDPLGLVAKGNVWYLVAAVDGSLRTYRVSRVRAAVVTDEPAVRPDDFDLAAYWRQSTVDFRANLPRYAAVVRAASETFPRMQHAGRFGRVEHIDPPDANGWCRVEMMFDVEDEAVGYVLSYGPLMEALEPASLREKVIEAAQGVVAMYQSIGQQETVRDDFSL